MPLRVLSAFNLKNQTSPKFRIWSYRFSFFMTVVNNSSSEGRGLILDLLGTLLTAFVASKSQELREVTSQEVGFGWDCIKYIAIAASVHLFRDPWGKAHILQRAFLARGYGDATGETYQAWSLLLV